LDQWRYGWQWSLDPPSGTTLRLVSP
jgi:hypothetical protein